MARPKNQVERKLSLVSAARAVIARDGLSATTLSNVAKEAGVSSTSLLYYYPSLKQLLDDVQAQAVERFCTARQDVSEHIGDPRDRLNAMFACGIPSCQDDELCKLLEELGAYARTDAAYAARHVRLFERQVSIYVGILEAGVATGLFERRTSLDTVARGLVAMEDGFGFHLLNVVAAIEHKTALQILRNYAELATGMAPGTLTERERTAPAPSAPSAP